MPPENNYYKVILGDEPSFRQAVEDLALGDFTHPRDPASFAEQPDSVRELQVIVGSPSKVAESTVVQFAKELTESLRLSQGWRRVHATVQPTESEELPPLGTPTHTDGDLTAWIIERTG